MLYGSSSGFPHPLELFFHCGRYAFDRQLLLLEHAIRAVVGGSGPTFRKL
jgi:hypothetical protein